MHFTKAIAIFISGEFTRSMVDRFMPIAPDGEAIIKGVLSGVDLTPQGNRLFFTTIPSRSWRELA